MRALLLVSLLASTLAAQAVVAPATETFDGVAAHTSLTCSNTLGAGDVYPTGWTGNVPTTDQNAWRVDNGGTTSGATGPSGDNTSGTGNYLYTETSCATGTWIATIDSPIYDVNALTTPTIAFAYHMFGADMGTLEVQVNDGAGNYSTVWTRSGDQGDQWLFAQVQVAPYAGASGLEVQFRFVGTRGASFTSDMAIDDVAVQNFIIPPWQTNGTAATLDFDGVQSNGFTPAITTKDASVPSSLNFGTTSVGLPADIVFNTSAIVAPGLPLGGQIVNLDVIGGGLTYLFNASFTVPNPGFGITSFNLSLPLAAVPGTLSAQGYAVDPASMSGVSLTQAAQLDRTQICLPGSVAQTLGDDSFVNVTLGFPFNFYGVAYSDCFIGSNGFITFGAGETDLSESVAEFLSNNPRIAFLWDDLNPSNGGTVTWFSDATQAQVCFLDVPEFSNTGANTVAVTFDSAQISMTYFNVSSADHLIGVSPGGGLDPVGLAIDLTAGVTVPNVFPAIPQAAYELFTAGSDVANQTFSFLLDGMGNPITQL